MPKRYYDDIDDGAPGEDDARYAGPTYNTMTAMPGATPGSGPSSSSSSSSSHLSQAQSSAPVASSHQQYHPQHLAHQSELPSLQQQQHHHHQQHQHQHHVHHTALPSFSLPPLVPHFQQYHHHPHPHHHHQPHPPPHPHPHPQPYPQSQSQLYPQPHHHPQIQHHYQPQPQVTPVTMGYDPSLFAPCGYSVTPPGVTTPVPPLPPGFAILPVPDARSPSPSSIAGPSSSSPAAGAGAGPSSVPASRDVDQERGREGGQSGHGQQRERELHPTQITIRRPRGIIPPGEPAHSVMEEDELSYTYTLTDEIRESLFRMVHGRRLNTLQPVYQLPADDDEIKRQEYFHKMMYIVMGDKNWVGPMEEVLGVPSDRKRRVLDIGCGSGIWSVQIADEFPDAEVVGCDLAPIQPDMVPPNLDFELFDVQLNPYPDEYFDVVHARGVHIGIRNYPLFLEEVGRILAPGGLVILVESEIRALTEGKTPIDAGPRGGAPGWHAFWEQYRRCLAGNHIDTTVPTRLGALLRAAGAFEEVVAQEATLPVGFWPKDDNILAVGEHAWMDHDLFIPGVRPLFLSYGLSEFRVKILVEDAQQDLYYPLTRPYTCVHVSHARKKVSWHPPRRRSRRLR